MLGYTCMSSISIYSTGSKAFRISCCPLSEYLATSSGINCKSEKSLSCIIHGLGGTGKICKPFVFIYPFPLHFEWQVGFANSFAVLKRSFKQHHHYQVSSSLNSGCWLRRLGQMAVIDSSSQAPVLGLTIEWRRAEHVDQIKVTFSPGS